MTLTSETMEPDTRERILVVGEPLFRQLGYQKTTVGDIAKELHMSPANVYRFFDSKKAIHEGVARTLMGEVELAAQAIVRQPGPATLRLRLQAARDGRDRDGRELGGLRRAYADRRRVHRSRGRARRRLRRVRRP